MMRGTNSFSCSSTRSSSAAARDASGRRPSDDALVDAVINESRRGKPFFIFAFPDSTHLPWNYAQYLDSRLDIIGTTLPRASHDRLKTYLNALHAADRAIGRLVEHFGQTKEPTLIVVLGDHRPALPVEAYAHADFFGRSDPSSLAEEHRCPVVFWSNFGAPAAPARSSDNFLAAAILRAMGLPFSRFFALNDAFRERLPVISSFVETADGRHVAFDSLSDSERRVVDDYALVQYDVLFGRQHLLAE